MVVATYSNSSRYVRVLFCWKAWTREEDVVFLATSNTMMWRSTILRELSHKIWERKYHIETSGGGWPRLSNILKPYAIRKIYDNCKYGPGTKAQNDSCTKLINTERSIRGASPKLSQVFCWNGAQKQEGNSYVPCRPNLKLSEWH